MSKYGILSYLSRSGSTYLSNKLNKYSDICVTLEASFPPELLGIQGYTLVKVHNDQELNLLISDINSLSKIRNWDLSRDIILEKIRQYRYPVSGIQIFKSYLDCFREKYKPQAKLTIYKGSPVMPWTLPHIGENWDDAILIYLQRDPRAIYSSQRTNRLPYSNENFTDSPFQVASDWKKSQEAVNSFDSKKLLKVKYENIMTAPETIGDIISFLKVSPKYNEDSFDYSQIIPKEEKSIHLDTGKSGKIDYIDKWKNQLSDSEIDHIEWLCRDSMLQDGYATIGKSESKKISKKYNFYLKMSKIKSYLGTFKKILGNPSLYYRRLKLRK